MTYFLIQHTKSRAYFANPLTYAVRVPVAKMSTATTNSLPPCLVCESPYSRVPRLYIPTMRAEMLVSPVLQRCKSYVMAAYSAIPREVKAHSHTNITTWGEKITFQLKVDTFNVRGWGQRTQRESGSITIPFIQNLFHKQIPQPPNNCATESSSNCRRVKFIK